MKLKSLWSDSSLHKQNAWADIILVHPFSLPLSKFLAKFKVNPNIVTFATVPICFLAAYMFATGNLVLGAFLYWFNYILDGTDGELARLQNRQSAFGSRWDSRTDTINYFMMYCGLVYSQYYLFGNWYIGAALVLIHYITVIGGIVLIQDTNYKTHSPRISSYYSTFEEGAGTFLLAPLFGVFLLTFPILVGLQVFSHIILFIKRRKNIKPKEIKTRIKRSILRVID